MKKLSIKLRLGLLFLLVIILNTMAYPFCLVVEVFSAFYDFQVRSWKNAIVQLPQRYRAELKQFDENGLRHNHAHLEQIKMEIATWPIKKQAEYVDEVTKKEVDDGYPSLALFLQTTEGIDFTKLNATSVGNLAYMVLHHPEESRQIEALNILNQIKEYFESFQ